MNPSQSLIEFNRRSENEALFLSPAGTVTKAFPDAGGWSIGYGHHSDSVTEDMEWTKEQAEAANVLDLETAAYKCAKYCPNLKTQGQFDCMTDFFYNVRITSFIGSHLEATINAGDFDAVPDHLRQWVYSGKTKIDGLVKRREGEIEFWNGEQS